MVVLRVARIDDAPFNRPFIDSTISTILLLKGHLAFHRHVVKAQLP